MTEEARSDWFAVAWETLKDIPPDILAIGAKKARQKCDHPSKIVPAIIAETKEMMSWQREARIEPLRISGPKPEYCSPEDAARILNEFGIKRSWTA
jgi:hypothetical protein